jgi:glycosyltransferase involved in cell wall biosynthesis
MTNRSPATCHTILQAAQASFPPVAGKPLVSVIIIFFNALDFLEEAIDSVFAQTYAEWELLLVDDGSTDASADIAKAAALRHPGRVSYLAHDGCQNRGTSASRNLGIRHAHGEYIAFLDADDVWLQHKLEQQVALFQAHPLAGMVQNALWPYRNPIRAAAREWRRAPVRQARRLVTTALRRSLPAPLYDWLRLRINREQLACGTASRLSPGGNAGGTVKSGGRHKLGR